MPARPRVFSSCLPTQRRRAFVVVSACCLYGGGLHLTLSPRSYRTQNRGTLRRHRGSHGEKGSASRRGSVLAVGLSAATAAGSGDTAVIHLPSAAAASERSWGACCDRQRCTRSAPPLCRNTLEQCPDACKECARVRGSDPPRYICKDIYVGDPAPPTRTKPPTTVGN
ncbi:Bowman-Birk type trypsin inhibitor-like isoform X2 [Panicum miliaceum]|uniref:Bowman-Birk type trypsin inhibitor-like isoform X2 n=1 Tax=Panicum miliaceum TaxID=4540 RepID=A0A3L6SKV8_PANMI|nr:Bowman-Birk type trypsin inhibitor-like isoform X2 [Panicum miliaceum]